ncbi:SDR family oxidoreductase [Angustibacter peucedani]
MTDGPRVVLVTGATSGIGLAVADLAASGGEHLVLLARSQTSLNRTAERCRAAGAGSVTTAAVDVTDGAGVQDVVDQAVARLGRLDVVVQSAGVVGYGRFEEVPAEIFDRVLQVNVLGAANVARAALPHLRSQGRGSLFLVGSVIGGIAVPGMSPYVVSKWGVRSLTRQLQLETRDVPGVRVCLVRPGSIDTPIYTQAANHSGRVGKPPPPVYRPETVARRVVAAFDHPPRLLDVGAANPLMVLGFTVVPRLYDAVVGPLFRWLGRERTAVAPTSGNVLQPQPEREQLRGRHPGLTSWWAARGSRSGSRAATNR